MQNEELCDQTLTELAELIRKREISAPEVVKAHLLRISRLNPALNAIVTLTPDVIEGARAAEGILGGLPITIKDTIETAGLRTTSGSKLRQDYVPERDAPAVARLKAAGAVVIGKTNAAEMAMDYNADNPVFGRTVHPQDANHPA
jgi:amidase